MSVNPEISVSTMTEIAQLECLEIGRTFEVTVEPYTVNCPVEINYNGQHLLLHKVMGRSAHTQYGLYEFDPNAWRHRNHYGEWINANKVLEVGEYFFFRGALYHG